MMKVIVEKSRVIATAHLNGTEQGRTTNKRVGLTDEGERIGYDGKPQLTRKSFEICHTRTETRHVEEHG